MAGDFRQRTQVLLDMVGTGTIEASVRVDQVYAQMQHEAAEFRHPGGGKAYYLRDPLIKNHRSWLTEVAKELFYQPMNNLFIAIADDFKEEAFLQTPLFESDLARSGEPRVKDRGRFIYRGPHQRRLSKAQLKIKTRKWHLAYGWGWDR